MGDKSRSMLRGGTLILFLPVVSLFSLDGLAAEKERDVPGFYPDVGVILTYDDNIRREETTEDADWYLRINPKVNWIAALGRHDLNIKAELDLWRYASESDEDAFDRYLLAELDLDISKELDINLDAGYSRSHTLRGHDPSAASVRPNFWKSWGVSGEAIYGRRTNKMQLSLVLDKQKIQFLNNDLDGRDHDQDTIKGTLFYNLGPKTQLLAEVSRIKYDYDRVYIPTIATGDAELDSKAWIYHLGINWEATAKTSGEFRIGYSEKEMEDARLTNFGGLTTGLNLVWKPKSYSTVDVLLVRDTQETKQASTSYVVRNQLSADWTHDLTRRYTLETGVTLEHDKWSEIRKDDLFDVYLGIRYNMRRWLDISARYTYQMRDSNIIGLDYDSNVIMIMFEAYRERPKRPKRVLSP